MLMENHTALLLPSIVILINLDEKLFTDFNAKAIENSKGCHVDDSDCNELSISPKNHPKTAHKYYKAVDCVNNISGGFITISSVFMIVLALLF